MKKQTKLEYETPRASQILVECRNLLMDIVLSQGMTEKKDLGGQGFVYDETEDED